jgi:energy-coupling factor transporter ATP-binding protein EcfA2
MITYAVSLRVDHKTVNVAERTDDILTLMNLHRCKNHTIEEYPPTRGEAGCEFRRLSIALEIVHLPELIVIDEPSLDFDQIISIKILECLKRLTKRGHIVFCSMDKPTQSEFNMFDRVVLLSEGYTIFSAAPNQIDQHFCSADMGYLRKKDVTLIDFTTDICSGIERPDTMRVAEHPSIMQETFEASKLFNVPNHDTSNSHAFTPQFFAWFGLFANVQPIGVQFKRFTVVMQRALYTKSRDYHTIRALFMASTVLSSFIGYLQYGQGNYGNFCLNLVGVPFKNTTNVGSLIFFLSLFTQAYFFVDAHSLCQKLQLFRYEQAASVNTAPAFFLATVVSEVPSALIFGLIFGTILFSMSQIYGSANDYGYFISTILMACMVGLSTAVMYCALFKKELAVRDMFFVSLAIVVLLSGFPFSQPNMPDYLIDFSTIIPTR